MVTRMVARIRNRITGHAPFFSSLMPLLQQLDAGAEADAGEEEVHKGGLQGLVKGEGQGAGLVGNQVQDGEDQSADHRCGNAAALEEGHMADREASDEEQDHGQGSGLQHIQLDG